jgi:cytochrome c551/c552
MRFIAVSLIAACWIVAGSALAVDMPPLAKKNNCVACHAIDKRVVGPSWMDVSRMYKEVIKYTYHEKEYPLMEGLVMKVSRGGAGNWGTVPMPGNSPAVKDEDIRELVKFILSLAK